MNLLCNRLKWISVLAVLVTLGALWVASQQAIQAQTPAPVPVKIDFNREIRPILSDKCWACHGPDAASKKIRLRLDSEASAKAELGKGVRGIAPGQPEHSEILKRIHSTNEYKQMPPPDSGRTLTAREKELLTEWIKQGAPWARHWSFVAPVRPAVPAVNHRAWVKNPVDAFVLARLEKDGLAPAPAADRATLLRRVSFDLTGLPPTLAELDDFLNDKAPNAYEKVVDRLLASPRYGERMAYKWLDAARYADTNGYQIDGDRSAWRWRDWVIEAFNQNKPFDEFVIEQLAGDLLPQPTLEQRIATAFNRNHRINAEGGIVPEEYRNEYVVDRVDTTSTVFLGLTMGCARCHNHKYDPLSQRDYYQMGAFFNSIDEDGHSFDQGNSPPLMAAPTREQQRQLQQLDGQIAQATQRVQTLLKANAAAQRKWEATLKPEQHWFPDYRLLVHQPFDAERAATFLPSHRTHHDQYDKKKEDPPLTFEVGYKEGQPQFVPAPTGQGAAFDGKAYYDGGIHADFRYKSTSKDYQERFTIAAWVKPDPAQTSAALITKVNDATADIEEGVPRTDGYALYLINGKLHFNLVFRWGEDALRAETVNALNAAQWQHIAVVFDGLQQWEARLHIYVNGVEQPLKFKQRNFFLLFGGSKNTLKFGAGGGAALRFKGAMDEARIYARALDAEEIAVLACGDALATIAALAPAQRTPAQTRKLEQAFIAQRDELRIAQAALLAAQQQRQDFSDSIQTLMVMQELPQPRTTFLLKRGAYDAPGETVERAVPAVLGTLPSDLPKNRLGFARWLTSADNPLLARVTVNRFWQMLFGTGLVKTSEDFGAQGELPANQELLDWLAEELRIADCGLRTEQCPKHPANQWNVKRLLKTIVMSATYQQSSKTVDAVNPPAPTSNNPHATNSTSLQSAIGASASRTPQAEAQHAALSTQHSYIARVRLSAEMIRDQALLVSGLLVEKVGGPSVKPYQPAGLYKDMAFGGLTDYAQAKDEGLWRRSLYTFWKRTILAPTMQVFDASAREFCSVRETRTNTPLQSLNLMNDVTYIEAARFLAQRMLKEGGAHDAQRLAWGFRVVLSRVPTAQEVQLLERALAKQRAHFASHPAEADKLLAVGERRNDAALQPQEIAAYAAVASLLLNLDETITKQ